MEKLGKNKQKEELNLIESDRRLKRGDVVDNGWRWRITAANGWNSEVKM